MANKKLSTMEKEPVTISAAILAVLTTVLTLAVSFGLDWSSEQQGAIIASANAVIILISLIAATRNQVTPNKRVVESLEKSGALVVAGPANDMVREGEAVREVTS